ncbi:peptidase s41 family [Fusarium albosuccineum]|uniref:Peptidase s41 family n=1 Tax=Fusarium albosuccineum TaxID=1237068 RepID=A0A8H4L558_9HYPO|nr:peptidase s41 family [Fusarium albosuccineum]
MKSSFGVLALAGLAAALEPRELSYRARNLPAFISSRDVTRSDTEPCKILSEAYEEANPKKGFAVILAVPPSVGIACLKSVPLDKERDLALIDYLEPLVSFQSTLDILADPPEEYLFEGVNVLGGLDVIRDNLKADKYETQYEVMTDLRSLFAAANDQHFGNPPALLTAFFYIRRGLEFDSISSDGIRLPQIFHHRDVLRGNDNSLDYWPSAVESVNDVPILQWLQEDAVLNTNKHQDPDAQFNNLFSSIPRQATGQDGSTVLSQWEVPDKYTIKFYNGSTLDVVPQIYMLPTTDFSGIESGEDFHKYIEIPTPSNSSSSKSTGTEERRSAEETSTDLVGYPEPVAKHSKNSVAGYFLQGDEYDDTAVLSILSFIPVGLASTQLGDLNFTDFILEGEEVMVEFIKQAKKACRDKLIIDLSANGGGSVILAQSIYRLLFPAGEFSSYDRYRANAALGAASAADYDVLVQVLITKSKELPVNSEDEPIKTGKEWFGPYTIEGGQNVTAAFQNNKEIPWDPSIPAYLNGFDPDNKPLVEEAFWKPENILIVTDGTCGSACNILTGLLTREQGIRTLALGGRPFNLAMQAMGGVKGTLLSTNTDIIQATNSFLANARNNTKTWDILEKYEEAFPSLEDPPLAPVPLSSSGDSGRVNALNSYDKDDLDGYPVHFRYEAANCRLFYTQRMLADPSEAWKHAYAVAWNGAPCVPGSTTSTDGTIGDKTVKYDARVRSRVAGIKSPGSLKK